MKTQDSKIEINVVHIVALNLLMRLILLIFQILVHQHVIAFYKSWSIMLLLIFFR